MGIFKRINDIISANLNDLTEGFENPEQMLRQAIREMEASITKATNETAKALAHEKLMRKELENNRIQANRWQERAKQAVLSGDDVLARKALERKKEHEKLVAALEDQLQAAHSAGNSLKRQLEAMKVKLAEARRSLATLSARHRAAEFRKKMETAGAETTTNLDQDAFAKFERFRSRVEQTEAEAEALAELRGLAAESVELAGEFDFEEAEEAADVSAQLAELKQLLKK